MGLRRWRSDCSLSCHVYRQAKWIASLFDESSMAISDFWLDRIRVATSTWSTPFYLAAWQPVEVALGELSGVVSKLPVRHWLSVKTQPLKPLLKKWAEC